MILSCCQTKVLCSLAPLKSHMSLIEGKYFAINHEIIVFRCFLFPLGVFLPPWAMLSNSDYFPFPSSPHSLNLFLLIGHTSRSRLQWSAAECGGPSALSYAVSFGVQDYLGGVRLPYVLIGALSNGVWACRGRCCHCNARPKRVCPRADLRQTWNI